MINKRVMAVFVVLGLLIIASAFLGPMITGYTVLSEKQAELEDKQAEYEAQIASYDKNVTELNNELAIVKKTLESCEESRDKTYIRVEEYMNKSLECKRNLKDIEDQCETEKANIQDELDECDNDLAILQHQYNEIINYAGNRICCIMKIYNSNINSFDVDEYEIKCREGKTGEHRIFCQVLD